MVVSTLQPTGLGDYDIGKGLSGPKEWVIPKGIGLGGGMGGIGGLVKIIYPFFTNSRLIWI